MKYMLIFTTPTITKVLDIREAPTESDAFEYSIQYDAWIEAFLTKELDAVRHERENADRDTL